MGITIDRNAIYGKQGISHIASAYKEGGCAISSAGNARKGHCPTDCISFTHRRCYAPDYADIRTQYIKASVDQHAPVGYLCGFKRVSMAYLLSYNRSASHKEGSQYSYCDFVVHF